MLNEADMPFSRCVRCADCDGFPCLVHAKCDAEVLGRAAGARSIRTSRCVTDTQVREAGDECRRHRGDRRSSRAHEGEPETYDAGIVVVSCGAANSAKLLLQSANDKHPSGLANGSDQVGRNYMFHNSQAVLALSSEPNPTMYQKTLGLNDFYFGMKASTFRWATSR